MIRSATGVASVEGEPVSVTAAEGEGATGGGVDSTDGTGLVVRLGATVADAGGDGSVVPDAGGLADAADDEDEDEGVTAAVAPMPAENDAMGTVGDGDPGELDGAREAGGDPD